MRTANRAASNYLIWPPPSGGISRRWTEGTSAEDWTGPDGSPPPHFEAPLATTPLMKQNPGSDSSSGERGFRSSPGATREMRPSPGQHSRLTRPYRERRDATRQSERRGHGQSGPVAHETNSPPAPRCRRCHTVHHAVGHENQESGFKGERKRQAWRPLGSILTCSWRVCQSVRHFDREDVLASDGQERKVRPGGVESSFSRRFTLCL